MYEYEKIKQLIESIKNKTISREKRQRDFGTGELLYRFEIHIIQSIGDIPNININRLAELFYVTKGAISQVVSKLEVRGYITKTRNNKEIQLLLTEKGEIARQGHMKFHERFDSEVKDYLSTFSKREKEFLIEILSFFEKHN